MKSLIEIINGGKTPNLRFIDRFDGDVLRNWWTAQTGVGSPTYSMSSLANNGFEISNGIGDNDRGSIDFNSIRPFNFDDCALIGVIRANNVNTRRLILGMLNDSDFAFTDGCMLDDDTDGSFVKLVNDDSTAGVSSVNTTVGTNTNSFQKYQIEINSTSSKGYIEGSFEAVNTSQLPTLKLQPIFGVQNRSASSRSGMIRYLEAWNI